MKKHADAILLDPQSLVAVRNLRLRARFIVDGLLSGAHRSPGHGFSAEFLEYRPYRNGESAAAIDWRVWARTDRTVVRLFEDETNLSARILLDLSASMGFASTAVSKFEYARTLAAALALLFQRQRDAVGLTLFDETVRAALPPSSSAARLRSLLGALEHATIGTGTGTAAAVDAVARTLTRRGLCILISDLFDDPSHIASALRHLRFKKQEVLVVQILDPLERDFAQSGGLELIDAESGRSIRLDGTTATEAFNSGFAAHAGNLAAICGEAGVILETVTTTEPVGRALVRILSRRSRLF